MSHPASAATLADAESATSFVSDYPGLTPVGDGGAAEPGMVFSRLRVLAAALMRATGWTAGDVSFRERPGCERDDEACSFDCIVCMLPVSYIVATSCGAGGLTG